MKVDFVEPMECALVSKLPEGHDWTYEVKFDGYRAIGVRSRETILYSRNRKNFNKRFPQIAYALADLPADTVIDGEVVALDESGRPDFHGLQHFTAEASRIHYFVFDLLILKQGDLTSLPLTERRKLLKAIKLSHRIWSVSNCSDMRTLSQIEFSPYSNLGSHRAKSS